MSFIFRFLKKLIPSSKNSNKKSSKESVKTEKDNVLEESIVLKQIDSEKSKNVIEGKNSADSSSIEVKKPKTISTTNNEKKKADKGKDPYGHEFVTKLNDWQKNSRIGFSSPIGERIIPIDGIDSTNDYISQYPFLPSGTIVVARRQTKGKGQKDRKWISNVGGLYFSFKLAFPEETTFSQSKTFWIQSALSLSTCKALKSAGLSPTLKWPNDIMISGKKIGGILGESKIGNQGMVIYLGLGLNIENNLNEIIFEFPELNGKISSVKEELLILDKQPPEDSLIVDTFRDIIFFLDAYWNSNFPLDTLKNEWISFSGIINKSIKFKDLENHSFEATVNEITEYGSLLVTTSNKEKKELTVGEIEFL